MGKFFVNAAANNCCRNAMILVILLEYGLGSVVETQQLRW